MTPRRLYGPVVLATFAAGGAMVLAAGRPWARVTVTGPGVPDDVVTASGNQAVPLVAALGLVVLTGALAVLATRGLARRVVGALVLLLGLAAAVLALGGAGATSAALDSAVEASPSFTGGTPLEGRELTPWRVLTGVVALVAAGLGATIVALAPHWPAMSGRYDRPATGPDARPGATAQPTDDDLWKALDEGRDPTE